MDTMPAVHRPQDDEIDISSLLHELWGYKWLLLTTMLVGLVLGVFYAIRQPAQYQSSVMLQIDGGKGGVKGGGLSEQLLAQGSGGDSAATQKALIQSRFVLEPVVEALGLDIAWSQVASTVGQRLFPWLKNEEIGIDYFDVPEEYMNKPFTLKYKEGDEVELYDKNTLILAGPINKELSSASHSIQLKAVRKKAIKPGTQFKVVKRSDNAVIKSLLGKLKVEDASGKNLISQGTGVLELSLKGREKQDVLRVLNTIAEVTRVKDADKKSEEASQTLTFLESQLPVTKGLLTKAEEALNSYRAKSGKIDIKIQTEFLLKQLSELDKQLNELEIQAIDMRQKFTSSHPEWIALQTQIEALKIQRNKLEKQLKSLPASDQVAVNLMRDVDVKQELYLLLLNKIQELQVVKAGTVSGVRILTRASLPDSPIPSKKKLYVLGGLILGFMAGVVFIFSRKLISPRVEDPHWSEKHLNLPNLAIVPFCQEQSVFASPDKKPKQLLLAHSHSKNLAVEALRSLRTSLQVTLACAENNVIGILGVAPSVGKTFVSCNLGFLLAVAGKKVLIIDTDLRKGTAHKYFGFESGSPGVSDYVNQVEELNAVIRPTAHENLSIITRGKYPKNPAEILSGERFQELVKTCSEQFDVVLFDTAPVILVTDAVIVSALAATNFLVLGAGAHQPSDVDLVFKRLHNAGVHLNGTIFNFHKEQTKNYYYGKYYNYSYYYHDESERESV